MKRTTKFILLIGLPLLAILLYLLLPITSNQWNLEFDIDKIKAKNKVLSFISQSSDTLSNPPNIILIVADDLGKTDISLYGETFIETPNIDAIGYSGVTFTEGYVTSPVCSPSRAGLLTGRYQQRFGYEYNIHERYPKNRLEYYGFKYLYAPDDWQVADEKMIYPTQLAMEKQGLPPSEITIAELLKTRNYKTGIIGKWHLGYHSDLIPNQRGFDEQYGFYEAFSLYGNTDSDTIINQHIPSDFSDQFLWKKGRTGTCAIRRNNKIIKEDNYLTTQIAHEAIQFIDQHQDKPFFLYLPFSAPHTPFQVPKSYYDQFDHIENQYKRIYYAMIKALDDAVGQITQKVQVNGLTENTMIIFISDNGGATYTLATDNAPLKGGKFTNFEGGINVPFMIQWKGTIPSGQVYHEPVSSLDIFPTIATITNTSLPNDRTYDGTNLIPFLVDEQKGKPHKILYWRSLYLKAICKGDWKLIIDEKSGNEVLYNLRQDKNERLNILATNKETATLLKADLQQWETTLSPRRWPRVMDFKYEAEEGDFYFPL